MGGQAFRNRPTVGGHPVDEVISLLQKAIRRGEEDEALWAASELDLSGFGVWAFSRMRVCASEDVGLAERGIVVEVNALHDSLARHAAGEERKRSTLSRSRNAALGAGQEVQAR